MNRKPTEELMNDVLDGVASPEDRERLDAILAQDPSARARYESLKGVFKALERVSMEPVPADLHDELLRALDREPMPAGAAAPHASAPPTPASNRRGGFLGDLIGALQARPLPALASTFAVGALIGVIGFAGMTGGLQAVGSDPIPVSGAIGAAEDGIPSPIDRARLGLDDVTVVFETRATAAGIELIADANAVGSADIEIGYTPDRISLAALRWSRPENGLVRHSPGLVAIEHRGIVRYTLQFERPEHETPIHVTVRANGATVEETLNIGPGGAGQP